MSDRWIDDLSDDDWSRVIVAQALRARSCHSLSRVRVVQLHRRGVRSHRSIRWNPRGSFDDPPSPVLEVCDSLVVYLLCNRLIRPDLCPTAWPCHQYLEGPVLPVHVAKCIAALRCWDGQERGAGRSPVLLCPVGKEGVDSREAAARVAAEDVFHRQRVGALELHHRREQALLRAEVVRDQRRVDPGGPGHRAHGGAPVAALQEQRAGRGDDELAGRRVSPGRPRVRAGAGAALFISVEPAFGGRHSQGRSANHTKG